MRNIACYITRKWNRCDGSNIYRINGTIAVRIYFFNYNGIEYCYESDKIGYNVHVSSYFNNKKHNYFSGEKLENPYYGQGCVRTNKNAKFRVLFYTLTESSCSSYKRFNSLIINITKKQKQTIGAFIHKSAKVGLYIKILK
jgi:hypothetical protein